MNFRCKNIFYTNLSFAHKGFGDDHIEYLGNHFEPVLQRASVGVDVDKLLPEWTLLKQYLYKRPDSLYQNTWESVNKRYRAECSNLLMLIDLLLTFPASSADCERGFSRAKLVKSDWRSKLLDDRVTDSLLIMLHTPDEDLYDPEPAVKLWSSSAVRRPEQGPANDLGKAEEECDEEEDFLKAALDHLAMLGL